MDDDQKKKLAKDLKTTHQVFNLINSIYRIEDIARDWKNFREDLWEKLLMCCTFAAIAAVFGAFYWLSK